MIKCILQLHVKSKGSSPNFNPNNQKTYNSLNPSHPNPGQREKITYIFIFTFLCGAPKGFMNALKAFIKPFETSQGSVKIKI